MESDIVLGFLEEPKNQAITQARFLPSKVGGAPAWISEQGKPGDRCGHCSYKLIFLMQLYANQDEEDPDLHRMLYVFACLSP
jgi:pre-rRNA-processing protein TSR4